MSTNPPIYDNFLNNNGTLTSSWIKFFQGLSDAADNTYIPLSYLDTDGTLASNSDSKIPSQKAVKTYVDNFVIDSECIFETGTAVNAVNAEGTVTINSLPSVNDTLVVGSYTFTFKSARTAIYEVAIGSVITETSSNLASAINTDVSIFDAIASTSTVVITAATAGTSGNSYTFTTTSASITLDGSGNLGGRTAGVNGTVGDRPVIDDNFLYVLEGDENTITGKNWRRIPLATGEDYFNVSATLGTQ